MTIAYLFRGQSYAGKRQYDRAIADYDEFIRSTQKTQGYTSTAANLQPQGPAQLRDRRFHRAIHRVRNLKPTTYPWCRLPRYGRIRRAIADYNEAIRLNPKYAGAYNLRGRAYHDKGDNDRAIGDYDEAIRLDPKLVEAYDNRGSHTTTSASRSRAIADCTRPFV